MKKLLLIILMFTVSSFCVVWAVDSTKPSTHNTTWIAKHGQASKINEAECLSCHEERLECIACHEDMAPRTHSAAWVQKNHGLESRWDRNKCVVCHKEDFCVSCHDVSVPRSHNNSGFGTSGSPSFHCQTSCQLPFGNWKNTPSKNCLVCHQTRPQLQSGGLHQLN